MNITEQPAWQSLQSQRESLPHLRELFASDPDRSTKFQLEAAGLFFDYSKNSHLGRTRFMSPFPIMM